ncbi:MAG: RNA 2',3'-cyclic phosphodiesterase [Bryobacterales bacterium]|nr:RNA 2',3'-cyclic phosphodiesterase [Bryobacterales bacterium]
MRLFVAIDIPDLLLQQIVGLIQQLRPAAKARWSPAGNLHITTKFLGEVDPGQLPAVVEALRSMPRGGPIRVRLGGLGWLPNPHSPRILYLGVQAPQSLPDLHTATDTAMAALGIPRETKPFRPHLTLARIPKGCQVVELRQAIAAIPPAEPVEFEATTFHLYESQLQPTGSVYVKRERFSL